ncbi:MAG: S41 family peptidase [Candidatus Hydrogenedentota bacterium]
MKKLYLTILVFIFLSSLQLIAVDTDLEDYYPHDTYEKIVIEHTAPVPSTPEQIKNNLNKIIDILLQDYVEELGTDTLFRFAVKGITSNLDPYTEFFEPKSYEQFQEKNIGSYAGLGIQITKKDDYITVVSPIPKTPAERAGVKPGDKIILIDGKDAKGLSVEDAVIVLRGEQGSTVTITVLRENVDTYINYTIVRDIIKLPTVEANIIDKYGYIRIYQFKEVTTNQFEEELTNLLQKSINALILDLRHNPGGLLNVVLHIVSNLIPPGKTIVTTQGRASPAKVYITSQRNVYTDLPLIVLVDNGSASGSEIIAGAVKDHKRGVLIGTTTFGKAQVQKAINLDGGYGIKFTFENYLTPNGHKIQGKGITPDICVEAETDTNLPPSWLADKPDPNIAEDTSTPKRLYLSNITDKQLQTAIKLLQANEILQKQ